VGTATFFEINGVTVTGIANDDVYRFVMDVAAGNEDIDQLAGQLRRLLA